MAETNIGKIVQVIGPVLDVAFDPERMPELYTALEVKDEGNGRPAVRVIAEVQQHIGRNQVRAVAMSSTDGLMRGSSQTARKKLPALSGSAVVVSARVNVAA